MTAPFIVKADCGIAMRSFDSAEIEVRTSKSKHSGGRPSHWEITIRGEDFGPEVTIEMSLEDAQMLGNELMRYSGEGRQAPGWSPLPADDPGIWEGV